MAAAFTNPELQRQYDELGYASFPCLDAASVAELREHYEKLRFEEPLGVGYKVTNYSLCEDTRRQTQALLLSRIFPRLDALLVDRVPYMSTYLTKEPKGHFLWGHQDWACCDETKQDSLMCWIPLCDVGEQNGGLGFIDGSHAYFDYLRGFPYMIAETPVHLHRMQLVAYLNVLRLGAGDAVVFDTRTIHGSLSNYTSTQRVAVSLSLRPRREPLLCYYVKPGGRGDTLLEYRVPDDFYVRYNNPRMMELFQQGKTLEEFEPAEEVACPFEPIAWQEIEAKLVATGNRRDPWKVAKTEEFYGVKLFA